MIDRSIPFYNIILRCDTYEKREINLPVGYTIHSYQENYEEAWANLEHAIGDFESAALAKDYFCSTYLKNPEDKDKLFFLLNQNDEAIGSCIAWKDPKANTDVSSLHWLLADERYQGKGLGKSLFIAVLNQWKANGSILHSVSY